MISGTNLRSSVLGTGIMLSAIGFSSFSAEAQERPQSAGNSAVAAAPLNDNLALDSASKIERLSGALKGLNPPSYDGPVAWKDSMTSGKQLGLTGTLAVIGALIGTCLVGTLSEDEYRNGRKILTGAAVGAAIFGGAHLVTTESISVIKFKTTIKAVVSAEAPHMETHPNGKSVSTTGPYFGQVVAIPETDMLLAANSLQAPLVPGQEVVAKFYVNAANQIVSWTASPDARQSR